VKYDKTNGVKQQHSETQINGFKAYTRFVIKSWKPQQGN